MALPTFLVLNFLNTQGIPDHRIGVLGTSLGGAVAINTVRSADQPFLSMILASTFQNAAAVFDHFMETYGYPCQRMVKCAG
ncbi:MAG: hypothetical protein U0003_00620 [Vampirovibrionales bacterium]